MPNTQQLELTDNLNPVYNAPEVAANGAAEPTAAAGASGVAPMRAGLRSTSHLVTEHSPGGPAEELDVDRARATRPSGIASLTAFVYDLQMDLGQGVRAVRERVLLNSYPKTAPPLRTVFMSDMHYGPTSGSVAARQAWRLAREANPDLVLLGGDLLFRGARGLPALLRELQRWKRYPPPAGIFACLGEHDLLAGHESLVTCLEACGVHVLRNDAVEMPAPWNDVWVVGTDVVKSGDPQPELALATVPRGACAIMVANSPEICGFNTMNRCSMTLCGGTHGGQICLPNGEPIFTRSRWTKEYPGGLYRHAGNWLFVSRGVGTCGLPFRIYAPPDIGVFEFTRVGARR